MIFPVSFSPSPRSLYEICKKLFSGTTFTDSKYSEDMRLGDTNIYYLWWGWDDVEVFKPLNNNWAKPQRGDTFSFDNGISKYIRRYFSESTSIFRIIAMSITFPFPFLCISKKQMKYSFAIYSQTAKNNVQPSHQRTNISISFYMTMC